MGAERTGHDAQQQPARVEKNGEPRCKATMIPPNSAKTLHQLTGHEALNTPVHVEHQLSVLTEQQAVLDECTRQCNGKFKNIEDALCPRSWTSIMQSSTV
ncbi:unnamed protein product [Prorocentrum cordatum]|uniref:Uncharacterized protein n=1 Tax=Prorocentrum cordatum TaxID=2364126 RepID=A0ABN9QB24_9DINO|nr:unnamed protein product [Polarella glacialis]